MSELSLRDNDNNCGEVWERYDCRTLIRNAGSTCAVTAREGRLCVCQRQRCPQEGPRNCPHAEQSMLGGGGPP